MKITNAIGRLWCRKYHRAAWKTAEGDGNRKCAKCGRRWHRRSGWRRLGVFS